MERLTLTTDELEVAVEPAYGGAIVRLGRPGGVNLLSERSWDVPLPASRSVTYGDDALDFLSDFRGGWHVLFPNAGAACTVDGVPLPFHGELARAHWNVESASDTRLEMRCPSRLPIQYERTLSVSGSTLLIEDVARNIAAWPVDVTWGHHPVCEATDSTRLDLPGGKVRVDPAWAEAHPDLQQASGTWPTLTLADGSTTDLRTVTNSQPVELMSYVEDLPEAWAAIRRPDEGVGVAYVWDYDTFQNLWFWVQIGGHEFPWYGQASVVALEPHSTVPAAGLSSAIERGTAIRIEAGQMRRTWIEATVFDASSRPVRGVGRHGRVDV